MRYTTTLVMPLNMPCDLTPPGIGWKYVDIKIRSDNAMVIVWTTDKPAPVCYCGREDCPHRSEI